MSTVLAPAAFAVFLHACAGKYPVILEAPVGRPLAHAEAESALHPYALHANQPVNASWFFDTKDAAVAKARELLAHGVKIDAGIMQVSSTNWPAYGLTVETAFDPEANVCTGARILGEAFSIERRAACRYNTGHPDCANGYPEMVDRAEKRIGAAGAGPPSAPVVVERVECDDWHATRSCQGDHGWDDPSPASAEQGPSPVPLRTAEGDQ